MTNHENQYDWLDEAQAEPTYDVDVAASDLALEMAVILEHAARARSDISQKALAELLNVTPGRVSQVLNGDGNFHVATIGRYLRALGYRLKVSPVSVDEAAPALKRDSRLEAPDMVTHVYKRTVVDADGAHDNYHAIRTVEKNSEIYPSAPKYVGSLNSKGRVSYPDADGLVTASHSSRVRETSNV